MFALHDKPCLFILKLIVVPRVCGSLVLSLQNSLTLVVELRLC